MLWISSLLWPTKKGRRRENRNHCTNWEGGKEQEYKTLLLPYKAMYEPEKQLHNKKLIRYAISYVSDILIYRKEMSPMWIIVVQLHVFMDVVDINVVVDHHHQTKRHFLLVTIPIRISIRLRVVKEWIVQMDVAAITCVAIKKKKRNRMHPYRKRYETRTVTVIFCCILSCRTIRFSCRSRSVWLAIGPIEQKS